MTDDNYEDPYETDLESIRDVVGEIYMSVQVDSWGTDIPFDADVDDTICDVAVGILARHIDEYIIADPHRRVTPRPYPSHIIAKKYDLGSLPDRGPTPYQLTMEIIQAIKNTLTRKNIDFDNRYEKLIIDNTESILSRHIGLRLIDDSEIPANYYSYD
ncbi:hypothetical protein FZC33_18750 [Labrys sp. KNU-23]|uniref:hypothetical protein n=1 Tax=Labrys sp. KNU-23 TaxID=2789216 RepID=UPI0011EC62ED|nr:hypothetical protein [Labrys sp. KNU-23]QEN88217.1 hypothetical protein FZC33_18750 [Labrys sp. KNU-23]